MIEAADAARFDRLFASDADPWRTRTRWYEARKRALVLACLPQPWYPSVFEPGCANGELSAALASRCDRLLAGDASAVAVDHARVRLRDLAHVRVEAMTLPADWPAERFDLVVLSELGYYLDADGLESTLACCGHSLAVDGTLLACHWRPPADDFHRSGDDVHEAIHRQLGLARLLRHVEDDFVLEVWCRDGRSVARREGLA